jgi:TonB-dependent receptor
VGNLPDRNIADALSRVPGVSLIADSGEGQFVTIRGMNPNLNNITLNGATLASSGIRNLDGRDSVSGSVVPLDLIGSANISQIEVIKTLTPDMDASAIGGTINLRTPSAFDRKGRFIFGSVNGGQSDLAKKNIYEGTVTFGNRFGRDDRVGIALSANYSHRPFRTEAFQSVWSPAGFGDSRYVPLALELLPETATRKRLGLTGNFEFHPTDDTKIYLKTVLNEFSEENTRQEAITRTNNVLGSFVGDHAVLFNNTRAEHRVFRTITDQTQVNATGGMSRVFGNLKLEAEATYSIGRQERPEMKSLQFRNGNINAVPGFLIDYGNFIPTISRGTSDFANPARFPLRIYDERGVNVDEDIATGRIDLNWAPEKFAAYTLTLKTGLKFYHNERSVRVDVQSYQASFNLGTTGAAVPGQIVMGKNAELAVDYDRGIAYIEANRNLLTLDRGASLSASAANTFNVGQNILAGYLMGKADFNKLSLLAGLRFEGTTADIDALEYRSVGTTVGAIHPNRANFEYSNLLPNIQGRYEFTKNLVLRGAITATLRRPEYEFAAPASRLQVNAFSGSGAVTIVDPVNFPNIGLLTIGNPELKPYEALNYDLALEYYLKNGGILSVAVFHKDISNPIYQTIDLLNNTVYNGLGFQELQISSYQNAREGTVTGVELYLQIPFTFLPGPLDGLGLDASLTTVSSAVEIFSRPGVELPFFEQPDQTLNLALYYQKGRFNARFAYTLQDSSLRQIGGVSATDFYRADHYQTDAQAAFKLSESFTIYANVQNITNQPQDTYQGTSDRLRFRRIFGTVYSAGLRFRF